MLLVEPSIVAACWSIGTSGILSAKVGENFVDRDELDLATRGLRSKFHQPLERCGVAGTVSMLALGLARIVAVGVFWKGMTQGESSSM